MPVNDTLTPKEAAFIATNAYFTLKDWINYSDGNGGLPKRNPVAGAAESAVNVHDRVLGAAKQGTYAPRHNTSLASTGLRTGQLGTIHTAKTGNNVESGFGYTLTYRGGGKTHVIVAVRGTRPEMGKADLLTDAHGSIVGFDGVGMVHAGFKNTYDSMMPSLACDGGAIASADVVHFVGHSLGGAVATLLAARYASTREVKLYTFGSPRVGAFSAHEALERQIGLSNIFRVAHNLDPISLVGPYPFAHIKGNPRDPGFMTVKSPFNLSMSNHDMLAYIDTVNKASTWTDLALASKAVKHDEEIVAQMLLHGGGDNPSWLRAGCARALSYLFKIFAHKLRLRANGTKIVLAMTAVDLLAELVQAGAHKLKQLGSEIQELMGMAAIWAEVKVSKGADFTGAIIKAILDRMLATIKSMALAGLTRGPIGLTPMGLAVPGWALASASGL